MTALPQADSALPVPPGHSVPAHWRPPRAAGPGLPAPAAAWPGGGASPFVLGSHPAAPSCQSPVFPLAPVPAEPLWRERHLGSVVGLIGSGLRCSFLHLFRQLKFSTSRTSPLPLPIPYLSSGIHSSSFSSSADPTPTAAQSPPLPAALATRPENQRLKVRPRACNPLSLGPQLSFLPGHFLASSMSYA